MHRREFLKSSLAAFGCGMALPLESISGPVPAAVPVPAQPEIVLACTGGVFEVLSACGQWSTLIDFDAPEDKVRAALAGMGYDVGGDGVGFTEEGPG